MTASPAPGHPTGLRPARSIPTGLRPARSIPTGLRPARTPRRAAAVIALAAGAALALTACGSGQISQTALQVSSINGNSATVKNIALRNVHVAYPDSEEYSLEEGGKAELVFTAVNTSENVADRLQKIETEGAKQVTLVGAADSIDIAPQTALAAGAPADQEPNDSEEPSSSVLVELDGLSALVRPGLTVPMTFTFAEAGDIEVQVPVDAGSTPRVVNDKSGAEAEGEPAEGHS